MGHLRLACAALLCIAMLAAPAPAPAQSTPFDPIYQSPGISPPGSNDFACRPSAVRPVPVILVHGTFGDMTVSWNMFSPRLARDGYCVFALDLPRRATAPVDESADVLAAFIDRVLAATGAAKVSLIGHSQGGMLPRYVARYRDKLGVIDDIVGLAPSNHGTDTPAADWVGPGCPACLDQKAGSEFMQRLNAGDEAPPPVSYTVVSTRHDQVATPYASQALNGSGEITNVVLQDRCPNDFVEHVGIIYDPVALQWSLDALRRPGPASAAFVPDCENRSDGAVPPIPDEGEAGDSGAPRVVLAKRRFLRARNGRVSVGMRCAGPRGSRCAGRVRLARKGRTVAGGRFSILARRDRAVRLRLTRAGKRLVRRRGAVLVRARAVVGPRVTERRYRVR